MRLQWILAALALARFAPQSGPDMALRARLGQVVEAEEAYYARHGTYTTEVGALNLPPQSGESQVTVAVIFAGGHGWTGSAQSTANLGKTCVIYVGDPKNLPKLPVTRAQSLTPTAEGEPVCDQ
jgi:hypothetical protein